MKCLRPTLLSCILSLTSLPMIFADPVSNSMALPINAVGVDLYRKQAGGSPEGNLLLSPYSITTALAMVYAGADGETQKEMQRVLHFPADEGEVHGGSQSLAEQFAALAEASKKRVERSKQYGGPATPIEFTVVNRLFAQDGAEFRKPFLKLVADLYRAPLESMDFRKSPEPSRVKINDWVAKHTKDKIRDLIPQDGITAATRLVLTNAIYLRAPWDDPFSPKATRPESFLVHGKDRVDVPTMVQHSHYVHAKRDGYLAIELPYEGRELSFLILLPNEKTPLREIETKLSAALFTEIQKQFVAANSSQVVLHLPKFRIEPPTSSLSEQFQALGLKTAFDVPPRSANFDRMAPRKPDDYLYVGNIFHKAFLALDEEGTEAAAATAVVMAAGSAAPVAPPLEVRVDRPFIFAILHKPSVTCLFLGRVTDPR